MIEPHLPPPARRGRTRDTSLRDVVDSIFYMAQSGCQWHLLPKDFPPYTTVQRYFDAWRDNGVWQTINHVLLMDVREAAGRKSQSDRWCDRRPVGQDDRVRRPARLRGRKR